MNSRLTLAAAAALAEMPKGTLGVWRHRGRAPRRVGLAEVAALRLARELTGLGLPAHAVAGIAAAVRGRWGEILSAGGRALLVATPTGDGWSVAFPRGDALPAVPSAVVVDGAVIVWDVFARLLAASGLLVRG